MSSELSSVITTINSEINSIIERNLLPHFETIRIIENLLKQMPEFKRLEQENSDLKERLSAFDKIIVKKTNEDIIASPSIIKNEIKLEIVESPSLSMRPAVSESELYTTVNLVKHDDNKLQEEDARSEADEDTSKADTSEADTSESEASEADTSESEASEAEEDAEEEAEADAEEDEVEDAEEEEADASEADEVEAEVEEYEADAEVEEEEVEAEAEADASEADAEEENPLEDGVEGAEPLDEEVYIIEIKGKGKFYTSNETSGDIYQIEGEDDVGDIVGKFVNKVATFL
jgi:hypothetical protein